MNQTLTTNDDPQEELPVPRRVTSQLQQWIKWDEAVLLVIVVLGGLLRFWGLAGTPLTLNQDELVNGYDAYSIARTGRDHLGHPFPFAGLESFGDWVSPLLTFLTVPVVGTVGLNEWAVRAVAVVVGIAAIPAMYLLGRAATQRPSVGLVAAAIVAVAPWAVHLSRLALPPVTVPTMVPLVLASLLWAMRHRGVAHFALAGFVASLTIIGYPTMKLYVPLIGAVFVLLYYRDLWRARAAVWAALGSLLIIAGPHLFLSTVDPGGRARLEMVSITGRDDFSLGTLWTNYWSYLGSSFLFGEGDRAASRVGFDFSLFPRELIPFMLLGVGALLYDAVAGRRLLTKRRPALLLLAALILAPLPGALTMPPPHGLRSAQLIPLLALLVGIGVIALGTVIVRYAPAARPRVRRLVSAVPIAVLILAMVFPLTSQYRQYYGEYQSRYTVIWYFQHGLADAIQYAGEHQHDYEELWIANANEPYVYVLFYLGIPPSTVHTDLQLVRRPPSFNQPHRLGKYNFTGNYHEVPEWIPLDSFETLYQARYPSGDGVAYEVRGGTTADGRRVMVIFQP